MPDWIALGGAPWLLALVGALGWLARREWRVKQSVDHASDHLLAARQERAARAALAPERTVIPTPSGRRRG